MILWRTFRIGRQMLKNEGTRWFVRCQNRTYDSGWIEIPPERMPLWREALRK